MLRFSLGCALVVALFASFASAQVATGQPPFASLTSGPDVTNLGNLNFQLAASIFFKPGRQIPFNYVLRFDNSVWYPSSAPNQSWTPYDRLGLARAQRRRCGKSRLPEHQAFML